MKILIAPLDWGLGHTTRCIPLIRFLLAEGHDVTAAAEGAAARLLQDNFPALQVLPLEGYRIRYSSRRWLFAWRILAQVPRIMSAIRKERYWLRQQLDKERYDLVISDNRYGLYHRQVACCILTHQLQIRSGMGAFPDYCLRRMHYRLLNRFRACWVVDEAAEGGLSGDLAHPAILPARAAYIGLLSQFEHFPFEQIPEEKQHILVLLSGPEPMRTQLESLVLEQAGALDDYTFTVVAGRPGGVRPPGLPEHIVYHSHLAAAGLGPLLAAASLVVCRSGYSTLMDLCVAGKRTLLVPTPGQTEQEYLAGYLQQKGSCYYKPQAQLDLAHDIPKALTAAPLKPLTVPGRQQDTIATLIEAIVPQYRVLSL